MPELVDTAHEGMGAAYEPQRHLCLKPFMAAACLHPSARRPANPMKCRQAEQSNAKPSGTTGVQQQAETELAC
jgi:hypothetical protein